MNRTEIFESFLLMGESEEESDRAARFLADEEVVVLGQKVDGVPVPANSVERMVFVERLLSDIGFTAREAQEGAYWLTQHHKVPLGAVLEEHGTFYWYKSRRWRSSRQLESAMRRFRRESEDGISISLAHLPRTLERVQPGEEWPLPDSVMHHFPPGRATSAVRVVANTYNMTGTFDVDEQRPREKVLDRTIPHDSNSSTLRHEAPPQAPSWSPTLENEADSQQNYAPAFEPMASPTTMDGRPSIRQSAKLDDSEDFDFWNSTTQGLCDDSVKQLSFEQQPLAPTIVFGPSLGGDEAAAAALAPYKIVVEEPIPQPCPRFDEPPPSAPPSPSASDSGADGGSLDAPVTKATDAPAQPSFFGGGADAWFRSAAAVHAMAAVTTEASAQRSCFGGSHPIFRSSSERPSPYSRQGPRVQQRGGQNGTSTAVTSTAIDSSAGASENEQMVHRLDQKVKRWGPAPPEIDAAPSAIAAHLRELTLKTATHGASRGGTLSQAATAMRHFDDFMRMTRYQPLRSPSGDDAQANLAYNEQILAEFATWLSVRPSPITNKPIAHGSIEGYVSAVRSQLMQAAHAPITPERSVFLSRTLKGIREMQPPKEPRKQRPALGAAHLRRLQMPIPADPQQNRIQANELAMVLLAYAALLRPSEIAYNRCNGAWRADRTLTRRDVTFFENGSAFIPYKHAIVMVLPRKKKRWQRVPQIVPYTGGAACAYTALERLYAIDEVPESEWASTPLVRNSDGSYFTTNQMSDVVARLVRQLGLGPEYTSYSLRIGGATDRREKGGTAEDIKQAGRWDSDIGEIYARPSAIRQAEISIAAYEAHGADVEHVMPGYVQPAWR